MWPPSAATGSIADSLVGDAFGQVVEVDPAVHFLLQSGLQGLLSGLELLKCHVVAGLGLRFSYKEQREFETIDDDLAQLEADIAACQAEQAACGSDYVKLQELQARQAELEAALEEKTERWVYLNELKEQINAQNG